MRNRRVILSSRPQAIPQAEHFSIDEAPVEKPGDGQILVRLEYLSVEPAMRGWLADTDNYSAPVGIGDVMRALSAGRVVESRHPAYRPGQAVMGWFGWQEWATVDASAVVRVIAEEDLPLSLSLGVLGLNGVTALLALESIGNPKAGETVLVSTAAGAVGSAVGQLAKMKGARTVGITGGDVKAKLCRDEFGYDAVVDYHAYGADAEGLDAAIAERCPDGVDVFFDNTSGPIADAAFRNLAVRSRVVVCGTAAISKWNPVPEGPRLSRIILTRRVRVEGFVIFDHMDRFDEASARLAQMVREGVLAYREEVDEGLDACSGAIAALYDGQNLGKKVIRLA